MEILTGLVVGLGIGWRGPAGMYPSSVAYGRRRRSLWMACVGSSRCQGRVFLMSDREGEGFSVFGYLGLYFLVRFVCILVLGSGTLVPV